MGKYSLVFDYSSFRTILLMIDNLKLTSWTINVETNFLNANLEEGIYMKKNIFWGRERYRNARNKGSVRPYTAWYNLQGNGMHDLMKKLSNRPLR